VAKFKGTDDGDVYTLRENKRDVVKMLDGNDTVYLSAASFDSDDRVNAGKGDDTAFLTDGGFYNIGHERLVGFESLVLQGEGRFEIYIDDSVGARGGTLEISAQGLSHASASLFIDGAPERDASLLVYDSGADDVIIGGGQADTFHLHNGNDLVTGNEGGDTFIFEGDVNGDSWGTDRVTDFRPDEDHLTLYSTAITSFDELLFEKTREGLIIRTPGNDSSITLLGLLPRDLDESDVTIFPLLPPSGPHPQPAFLLDHGVLA
jgi:Ca2+-binding RTX toxin-like protein